MDVNRGFDGDSDGGSDENSVFQVTHNDAVEDGCMDVEMKWERGEEDLDDCNPYADEFDPYADGTSTPMYVSYLLCRCCCCCLTHFFPLGSSIFIDLFPVVDRVIFM